MTDERLRVMAELLADPPAVHEGAPAGVWRVEGDSCYAFLAGEVELGTRTLEIGLGLSTALFAAWGAEHLCVVNDAGQVERLLEYLRARDIATDRLEFEVGPSDVVLPRLSPARRFDLVFIDGCHGFPMPAIDWFYGAARLGPGGVLVFDDMQIPAVSQTIGWFCDLDPRWSELERNGRWAAYRRETAGPLGEEWTEQLFLGDPRP